MEVSPISNEGRVGERRAEHFINMITTNGARNISENALSLIERRGGGGHN